MEPAAPPDVDAEAIAGLREAVARKWLYRGVKRALDTLAALLLIVLLAMPMLVIAAAVRLTSPGPAFYQAPRGGLHGRPFVMLKFRSMRPTSAAGDAAFRAGVRAEGRLAKSADDPRVTRLGRWLRRRSLDELPQLFNVLRGEMALIGPRPVMPEMLHPYPGFARARALVRPGLGGLWQVRARDEDNSVVPMWRHDLEYVARMGFGLDLALLLHTILIAARTTGAR